MLFCNVISVNKHTGSYYKAKAHLLKIKGARVALILSKFFYPHQALKHLILGIPLLEILPLVFVTMDCQLHQLIQKEGRELLDQLIRHSIWVHVK